MNTSLMTGTCAGWIAILPVKPSRRAFSVSRRSPSRLRKSDIDGVDRRHASPPRRASRQMCARSR